MNEGKKEKKEERKKEERKLCSINQLVRSVVFKLKSSGLWYTVPMSHVKVLPLWSGGTVMVFGLGVTGSTPAWGKSHLT